MTKDSKKINIPKGMKLIFRPYRTNPKTKKTEYASQYGMRAFPMLVPIEGAK